MQPIASQPDYPTSGFASFLYELRLVVVTMLLQWAFRVAPRGLERRMLLIQLQGYLQIAMWLIRERRRKDLEAL